MRRIRAPIVPCERGSPKSESWEPAQRSSRDANRRPHLRLCARVVRDHDLAAAVVAAGLADRVRSDHRPAVRAADQLRACQRVVRAAVAALRAADFALRSCHVRVLRRALRISANRRAGRSAIFGAKRLRLPPRKSTVDRGNASRGPTGATDATPQPARPHGPLAAPQAPSPRPFLCPAPSQGDRRPRRPASPRALSPGGPLAGGR